MNVLEYEYHRFVSLRNLKRNFLQICGLQQNDAIKVWSNWVIINRVRVRQVDSFLPTQSLELDNKTVSLLIEKGTSEEEAIHFYNNLIQQCQRYKLRYLQCSCGREKEEASSEIMEKNMKVHEHKSSGTTFTEEPLIVLNHGKNQ